MAQAIAGVNTFTDLIDLASARFGSRAIATSDDFFAEKDNLLKPEPAVFIPGKFTERGKWMDGWESRRKRTPGHDWCIIALGRPGSIVGFNVDTAHFNGNQPQTCTIDAVELPPSTSDADLTQADIKWTGVVGHTPLQPTASHLIPIAPAALGKRFTHLRLNMHPDGGIARLRAHGHIMPDWAALIASNATIDLAAAENAGLVVACNDMHFGSRHNLVMPGRAVNMGDGWETRRKRNLTWTNARPNEFDWCIVQLGHRGVISQIEVDTNHFKGNFPESCAIEVCDCTAALGHAPDQHAKWTPLLPRTALRASHQHVFDVPASAACTHARLNIYPDGGISRLRLLGKPML